jgi:tetratricopeptide (TPR) repeat protein
MMTPGVPTPTDETSGPAATYDAFVEAALAAREGRYTEALRHLSRARTRGECTDAESLDLEARIFAQQGYYLRAESAWERAKSVDPGNAEYDRALYRLRGVAVRGKGGARGAVISLVLVVLASALTASWYRQSLLAREVRATVVAVERLAAQSRAAATDVASQLVEIDASLSDMGHDLSARAGELRAMVDSGRAERARLARGVAELTGARRADSIDIARLLGDAEGRLGARLDSLAEGVLALLAAGDTTRVR